MKIKILLFTIFLFTLSVYAECPNPSSITYDDAKGWQVSTPGWQISGSKYYQQNPQVIGLHNALWNGFSGRFTCIYEVKLKSGAHPQVTLYATKPIWQSPSGGEWAEYPNLPKQMTCPLNPAPLSVLDVDNCPFSY